MKLTKHITFPSVPMHSMGELTSGKVYELAGLSEDGIPCIIDDNGDVWTLDDGYGSRYVDYQGVFLEVAQ